ncbi:MAG TPA: mechanosensitive ion channel family protein [Sulfuricaulis sp.]|nr:mechanosensitive ion channel family protein [Sulfuricaulis sp.]
MNWLERSVYGNPLTDWLLAGGIVVVSALVLLIARRLIVQRLAKYARATVTPLDDMLVTATAGTRGLFLVVVAFYAGAQFLDLPPKADRLVTSITIIALLVQAALWMNRGIAAWLAGYLQEKKQTDAAGATTVSVLGFIARVAVWAVVVLMILDNLGFNITTLVASLGIGGIAVALAVQNILGDIFASLSIALDKPFVIGDFIIVDDVIGTVDYIGLKTTRLRSLSGEQIVFSNADLLKSRIRNYKRMFERRVIFTIGVVYQTTHAKLERIPALVRSIVEQQSKTRLDRAHFKEYGDSALVFEVVYFVLDPDYNIYMDIQQAINLAIFRRFQEEGIEFAYPTRTLHVHPSMVDATVGNRP